ncbi:MAG: hypothetical protein HKN47_13580 [Pirellulaceae bacterium]|nr:hypothetical protein [Pirellulaceae bacterium]
MRSILVIGLVLGCAFMAGWFTINRDGGETTIRIDRDEIRSDAKTAINRGREYLDQGQPGHTQYPETGQQPADGQTAPASWTQYQNQQYPNQQYPNQQYTNQQYTNQSYPNQQYPNQQYQAPQPQTGNSDFYYPNQQHANRPPAPWENQAPAPSTQQQVPYRQF